MGYVIQEFDWVGIDGGHAGLHDGGPDEDKGDVGQGDGNGAAEVTEPPVLAVAEGFVGIGPVDDGIADLIH